MFVHSLLFAFTIPYIIASISNLIPSNISIEYSNLTSFLNNLHDLHLEQQWNNVILATDSQHESFYYSTLYLKQTDKVISTLDYNNLIDHKALNENYRNVQNVAVIVLIGREMNSDLFRLIDLFKNRQIFLCLVFLNVADQRQYFEVLKHSNNANLYQTIAVVNEKSEIVVAKLNVEHVENCESVLKLKKIYWNSPSMYEVKSLMQQKFNFNKCPVNISTAITEPMVMYDEIDKSKLVGMEVSIIKTVAEVLNFTPNLMVHPEWGVIDEKRETMSNGLFKHVFEGSSEIGFGTIWPNKITNKHFDMTRSYYVDCITWSVPPFSGMTVTQKTFGWLTKGFKPLVWILILVFVITVSIVWTISYKINKKRHNNTFSVFTIGLLISLCLLLQKPIPQKFVQVKGILLFFVISWYMYMMVMNTIYCGYLSSSLSVRNPWLSVQSFDEILERNLSLIVSEATSELFSRINDPYLDQMKNIGVRGSLLKDCLDEISKGKWMAFSECKALLLYYKEKRFKKTRGSRRIFDIIDDCYIRYPVVFILKKGSMLTKKVNHIIQNIFESGIIKHWTPYFITTGYYLHVFNTTYRPWPWYRFYYIFRLYLCGNFIAFLVFIVEYFYPKLNNLTSKMFRTAKRKIIDFFK